MSTPLVSIGIPLYRSARFFDVVAENIDSADYPNLEIIVSDRHMADDTLDRLSDRFPGDPRIRFLRDRDGINWVEHYNLLLREARGRYFCWMPHDDSFPGRWITVLVACLERDPEIVLACGRLRPMIFENGAFRLKGISVAAPDTVPASSASGVLDLLRNGRLGVSMRGVFRRDLVVERQLWIQNPRDGVRADTYWLFALALVGRLHAVDEVECLKRYYPESTHAHWHRSGPHVIGALPVLARYAHRIHGCAPRAIAPVLGAAGLWASEHVWHRQPKKLQRQWSLMFKFVRRPIRGLRRMREMGLKQVLWRLRGHQKVHIIKPPRPGGS